MGASVSGRDFANSEELLPLGVVDRQQVRVLRAAYSRAVSKDGMSYWVALAASQMRESKGRMMVHIAAELSTAESKISRFERHVSFPRDLDATIAAYARDLDVAPIEIWTRALELWRADASATPVEDDGPPAPPGKLGRDLRDHQPKPGDPADSERRAEPDALGGNGG